MKDSLPLRSPLLPCLVVALALAGCASYSPAPVVERSPPATTAKPPAAVPGKDVYVVKKGDTLYSIALEHGLDYKDLVAWNNIDNPNRIAVGQWLRIANPTAAEAPATGAVAVVKPVGAAGEVERRSLDGNTETFKREPRAGKEPYSDETYARLSGLAVAPTARVEAAKAEAVKPEAAKPEPRPAAAADAAADGEPVWAWPSGGKLIATFNDVSNKGVDIAGRPGDPVLAASDGKVVYSGTGLRGYGQLVIVKHNAAYLSAYAHNSKILVKEGQAVTRGQKIAEMGNTDADQVKLHFEVRRQGKPVDPMKYLPPR